MKHLLGNVRPSHTTIVAFTLLATEAAFCIFLLSPALGHPVIWPGLPWLEYALMAGLAACFVAGVCTLFAGTKRNALANVTQESLLSAEKKRALRQ